MFKNASQRPALDALQARRDQLSEEHHHLTLAQQEAVASDALRDVDAILVCAGLTSDEPTGRFFVELAQRATTAQEREAYLRLSTLQSSTLKTPIMCALATALDGGTHDRTSAVRCALAHSGGAITAEVIRAQLQAGPMRWQVANDAVAAASSTEQIRAFQVLRLASHTELIELLRASRPPASERGPARRRRSARAATRAVQPEALAVGNARPEPSETQPRRRRSSDRGRLTHGPRIDPAVTAKFAA